MKVSEEMERLKDSQPARLFAPSRGHMQQTLTSGARHVLPSDGGRRNFFSKVFKNERINCKGRTVDVIIVMVC